jgi:hypothetical protein
MAISKAGATRDGGSHEGPTIAEEEQPPALQFAESVEPAAEPAQGEQGGPLIVAASGNTVRPLTAGRVSLLSAYC